jgi:pilus assembly protein CpaF
MISSSLQPEEAWGCGPLRELIDDESCDEIMVNSFDAIWIEKAGRLTRSTLTFSNEESYQAFVNRLLIESALALDLRHPVGDTQWRQFRLHITLPPVTHRPVLSFRRLRSTSARFEDLLSLDWAPPETVQTLRALIANRQTILVAGPTGSGKTTFIQAALWTLPEHERCAIIEDSPELTAPNSASVCLRTRYDSHQVLPDILLGDLVRHSLRMRPDRLVLGEVRGAEARDLVLALSSGHRGSFGSIHAKNDVEALRRLEVCVQLGAPHWSLETIRRLLAWSIDAVVVVGRDPVHPERRCLQSLSRITSVEEHGLLLESVWNAPRSSASIQEVSARKESFGGRI